MALRIAQRLSLALLFLLSLVLFLFRRNTVRQEEKLKRAASEQIAALLGSSGLLGVPIFVAAVGLSTDHPQPLVSLAFYVYS
jgi:hypothetical protein